MKQTFSKITSFLLAVVVLFSTMSFTIDKHYCGTVLVDIAINAQAERCGMQMAAVAKDDACSETALKKKSCCKDEHVFLKGQDELQKQFDTSLELPVVFTEVVYHNFQAVFIPENTAVLSLNNHDPPDRDINFQVLYACYLI